MSDSAAQAAGAAIERLRVLREQAKRRREQTKEAVQQVRERNRQESVQVMERVKAAKRPAQPWPSDRPVPQMNLYDTDEPDTQKPPPSPQSPPPQSRQPNRVEDDDWSQETWLH